jgi:hypothetical protein
VSEELLRLYKTVIGVDTLERAKERNLEVVECAWCKTMYFSDATSGTPCPQCLHHPRKDEMATTKTSDVEWRKASVFLLFVETRAHPSSSDAAGAYSTRELAEKAEASVTVHRCYIKEVQLDEKPNFRR